MHVVGFASIFFLFPFAVLGRVEIADFFPFGSDKGDATVPNGDDNGISVNISRPFPFFNSSQNFIYVNTNGVISLRNVITDYTPTCTPVGADYIMIEPYWADIDTQYTGDTAHVFFRETTNAAILQKANEEVQRAFPQQFPNLNLNWAFITTWSEVTFFGAYGCFNGSIAAAPRNTFQAVVTTDGTRSFVIFNYNKLLWNAGTASGADCQGKNGSPAIAGFDAGDGTNYLHIGDSCSESVVNLVNQSNVNQPGKWIFATGEATIQTPKPVIATTTTTEAGTTESFTTSKIPEITTTVTFTPEVDTTTIVMTTTEFESSTETTKIPTTIPSTTTSENIKTTTSMPEITTTTEVPETTSTFPEIPSTTVTPPSTDIPFSVSSAFTTTQFLETTSLSFSTPKIDATTDVTEPPVTTTTELNTTQPPTSTSTVVPTTTTTPPPSTTTSASSPCPTEAPAHRCYLRCPSGWTYFADTRSCYKVVKNCSFDECEEMCQGMCSHLTSIHSDAENKFVNDLAATGLPQWNFNQTLIGFHQIDGEWTWTDSTPFDYQPFAPGQPDNNKQGQKCGLTYSDVATHPGLHGLNQYFWDDVECNIRARSAVCKKAAGY